MKRSTLLFAAVVTLLFASIANARVASDDLIDTSAIDNTYVVSPGTRLAVGGPNQNDFYILGQSASHSNVKMASKTDIAKIKMAISESLQSAAKYRGTTKSLAASKTGKHKIAKRKTKNRLKIGLQQKHRPIKSISVDG